jgi:hypothetical protein
MDSKHVFLASNYHKDNEVVPISRRLTNGQRITIACSKAVKDYCFSFHMELNDSTKEYPVTVSIASLKDTGFEFSFIF